MGKGKWKHSFCQFCYDNRKLTCKLKCIRRSFEEVCDILNARCKP
ncbi:MAG: hypothetical protein SOU16_04335 [Faecalimonas sp.]|nr:hypothetical protein [Clostridiales bacterium]MDU7631261.1 hypothetical protein [Lachnospiraceae bacterium]MDY2996523.1 hypothetical protein [Faecalimonas sp.]